MKDRLEIHSYSNYETLSLAAANYIFQEITTALSHHNRFVLGMATGSTPLRMYVHLLSLLERATCDFSSFYTVNLDEYYPIAADNPHSYYWYMQEHFWVPLARLQPSFNPSKQSIFPNGQTNNPDQECIEFESAIKQVGGIDLQILGIGTNGHIGFNEPGSSPTSRTRLINLAETSRIDNAIHFGGDLKMVPHQAITMGIQTILEAKKILLLANGRAKQEIMQKLAGMSVPAATIPASYLLDHPATQVVTDALAAV